MRLAEYTDYTLRVLMYCAAHPERLITIAELTEKHGVSKNHLMKVVNDLARQGLIETTRGARRRPALADEAGRDPGGRCGAPVRNRLPARRVFRRQYQHVLIDAVLPLEGRVECGLAGLLQGAGCGHARRHHQARIAYAGSEAAASEKRWHRHADDLAGLASARFRKALRAVTVSAP